MVILQPDAERLRHFDQVVVLSNGRLVESGAPEEVMQSEAERSKPHESLNANEICKRECNYNILIYQSLIIRYNTYIFKLRERLDNTCEVYST